MNKMFLYALFAMGALQGEPIVNVDDDSSKRAVTYEIGGGRFGDQLLGYLHAKWISYRYGMPLLYIPFSYSKDLVLDREERRLKDADYKKYEQVICPTYLDQIDYAEDRQVLYLMPYFPESLSEHTSDSHWYYFAVDWKDPGFKAQIQKLVSPASEKTFLSLPEDRISVAVHVRLGGGFDALDTWKGFPLKLPPKSYYKEQLRNIYDLLGQQPLYVYIFTDDGYPKKIAEEFQAYTQDLDIVYAYRSRNNMHNANVLEDFFQMTKFSCMIRPESNFSLIAAKLANLRIEISPIHFTWTGPNEGYVDQVEVIFGEVERASDTFHIEKESP